MVLLVAKINKLYSKMENLHNRHNDQLSEAFEVFFSEIVSNGLAKLLSSFDSMSFSWIHRCFELINTSNKAFAKFVVSIDYPMSHWKSESIDSYLSFSLNLLEFFNSISSSLSILSQSRVSLSHALCLKKEKSHASALRHLKAIEPLGCLGSKLSPIRKEEGFEPLGCLGNKASVIRREEAAKRGCFGGKEEAIREAVLVMESLGIWVCGVVLLSLRGGGDSKTCDHEMRRVFGDGFSGVFEGVVEATKEVREVNEAVISLVAAMGDEKSNGDKEAEELRKRLEVFEAGLEGFGAEVDRLFKEVLRGRNQMTSEFQVQGYQRKE